MLYQHQLIIHNINGYINSLQANFRHTKVKLETLSKNIYQLNKRMIFLVLIIGLSSHLSIQSQLLFKYHNRILKFYRSAYLLQQINQRYNCYIQMNLSFENSAPFYNSHQNAALYFNSLSNYYDYPYTNQQSLIPTLIPLNLTCSYYPTYTNNIISELYPQRPTDDQDILPPQIQTQTVRHQPSSLISKTKMQEPIKIQNREPIKRQNLAQNYYQAKITKRIKNLKKNTELNLINNVYSYISCEKKSHRAIHFLLKTSEKIKIFYIFSSNLKRLNGKYLNHQDLKMLNQLHPNQPQAKMLSKSVKRLQTLPMNELRIVLRKTIMNYLRGQESLLPLLTSKKISRESIQQHLQKRRELIVFMTTQLEDCNLIQDTPTQKKDQ